jgi:hypothetical protein
MGVVAPRNVCRSVYFTIPYARKNPSTPIEKNEIGGVFSQYLWKYIEINKKLFAKENSYDDLGVLLLNNLVAGVGLDGETVEHNDDIFGKTGKKITIGMVQSFVFRPFFSALAKTFPKRALFKDFHEQGFCMPLSVLLNHLRVSEKKNKRFVFAGVGKSRTSIHVFDGLTMAFYDSFAFGSRSFYEVSNHYFGLDLSAYLSMFERIVSGNLAPGAKKKMMEVLDKELNNLSNGISSFKTEIGAQSTYINGGSISGYLKLHKRFADSVVDEDFCDKIGSVNVESLKLTNVFKADVGCMLGLSRNDQLNVMAMRQIRWLIPHTVEVR